MSIHPYWLHAIQDSADTFQSSKLLLCGLGPHSAPSPSGIDHSVYFGNSVINNVSQKVKDAGKVTSVHGCTQLWEVGMDHGILGSAAINYD